MIKFCKSCQRDVDAIVTEVTTGPHHGKSTCPVCNRFIDWVKKPENEGIRTKTTKFTLEILHAQECELCGRPIPKLGKHESLEIHHKKPIEEGGEDVIPNLSVFCTPCHRMAHFMRTYLHRHLDDFYTFYVERGK